jgi:glycerophosphoryl diester phosphodiesterase
MRRLILALTAPLILAACSDAPDTAANMAADSAPAQSWATRSGEPPIIIAHRGASGARPEHSEAAYALALQQGADVLEPDLQMSSDGQLIVRHDPYLSTSTDVSSRPEFADRLSERNGRLDWWVIDFTAAELRSLTTRQVFEDRAQEYNDQYPVLTFEDFLDFVSEQQILCGCTIAMEPEIKLPGLYTAAGLDPLPALLDALDARDLHTADAPVVIQSFEPDFLRRLRPQTELALAMLYAGPGEDGYDAGGLTLQEIADFADGVGAFKGVLMDAGGASTGYLERAHALGLDVHVWTVRDDRTPLAGDTVQDELRALYALGVDAVFTDHPATAVAVRGEVGE